MTIKKRKIHGIGKKPYRSWRDVYPEFFEPAIPKPQLYEMPKIPDTTNELVLAIAHCDYEKAEALVRGGMDLNEPYTPEKKTPFMYLIERCCNAQIIETFIKLKGRVNSRTTTGETPLTIAIKHHMFPNGVKTLLKYGANVNRKNKDGMTPLMLLITHSKFLTKRDMFHIMVAGGADLTTIRNKDGKTALELLV